MIDLAGCPCTGKNLARLVHPAILAVLARESLHDVAGGFPLSGKYFSCSFGGKKGPNDAHAEHDEGEQQKHLGRIIEQELQGVTEMTALSDSEHLVGEEPGKSRQHALADRPPRSNVPDPICLLVFTSGSTGRPKAVAHTQERLARRVEAFIQALDVTAEDTTLAVFHAGEVR